MSYNILNKNVNFQGATAGTVEGLVDSHSDQSISGSKDFLSLSASVGRVANDLTVLGNVSASVNISASAFYGDGTNLSNVGAVTALNNATANELVTVGDTTTELDAESNLTFDGSTLTVLGNVTSSINMSASAFYGNGANLSNVNAATVTLASNSGLANSSGLIIDPNNALEETSANNSHFLLIYNGSALKKITCERVVGLVDVSDFMSNGVDNRVLTAAGADTMNAEAKLLFDATVLTVDANISGSGTMQNVGAAIFGGGITVSGTMAGEAIGLANASGIAGLGLGDNNGNLDVQTTGGVKITNDRVAISGSMAGYGITFSGSADAVSAFKIDVGGLTEAAIDRTSDFIVFADADDEGSAKRESVADLVGFIAGSGLSAGSGQLSVNTAAFTFTTLSASSTLQAVGATTLGNTLTVSGSSAFAAISGSGTLQAVGATTLGSTLTVSGSSTLQAVVFTTLSGSGTVHADGNLTIGATFAVTGSGTFEDSLTVKGPFISDMSPVTNFTGDNANATIPITKAAAQIDANGSARTGMRFAGSGIAGQFITVINTGGENVTFHNTEGTALVRGINPNKDTIRPGEAHLFISDGSLWNHVGGGATDEQMTQG